MRDHSALTFGIRAPSDKAWARFAWADGGDEALSRLRRYVDQNDSAELFPLYADASHTFTVSARATVTEPVANSGRFTSGTHFLKLASSEDREAVERMLRKSSRVAWVETPALRYPLVHSPSVEKEAGDEGTSHHTCNFHWAWQHGYDVGRNDEHISVVDCGTNGLRHPELAERVRIVMDAGSTASHGGAVASVISARRGEGSTSVMDGCCCARLNFFNVSSDTTSRVPERYYQALREIALLKPHVVNFSIGGETCDRAEAEGIALCLEAGHVLVAAVGDSTVPSGEVIYPAAYQGVIGVGACDRFGNEIKTSFYGAHVLVSAPCDDVDTVDGDRGVRLWGGTSFATPMVAAAVWMARQIKPHISRELLRALLAQTANPGGRNQGVHHPRLGYGCLDVQAFLSAVSNQP